MPETSPIQSALDKAKPVLGKAKRAVAKAAAGLEAEQRVLATLHRDVQATLRRLKRRNPGLTELLDRAHGYAVFPSVGKAAAVVGGAFGKGEVFAGGKLVGYAGVVQLTIGVQLGGQTFAQVIAFENPQSLARFKANRLAFAAGASAVLVKARASAAANYEKGVAVLVFSDGGLMLELALGGQKFIFKPAVLGRGSEPVAKSAQRPPRAAKTSRPSNSHKQRTSTATNARRRSSRSARGAR